ncbi:MAG: UvrD-helicase domain-containing protein [Deltaproteobacteria bacterium]|nr:UvrD-helicase domain-containing protein [Deltaproteobacteria bacterium]
MFEDLTLQQFCALDYNRNMVVTSGPGAGKTRILSNRFCFILLTDPSVSLANILTLTFTEKAAEEMKERIYRMIGRIEGEFKGRADDGILLKIRQAREQFNKARISTIHSFCADLLRENPVESNIDAGFSVIQGARQRDLMEESIESAISSIWRSDRDLLSPLLVSFGGRRNLISALHNIISHPMTFESAFITSVRLFGTPGWTDQVFREYCGVIRDKYILPYLEGLKDMGKGRGQYEELLSLLENWRTGSGEGLEYSGIPELFMSMRRLAEERQGQSASLTVEQGMKKISYGGLLEEFYPDIFRDSSPDLFFERECRAFMDVAQICLERYRAEKRKINALDFADLEKESHSFLSRLRLQDRARMKRLQKGFSHIMVDEFQDTNIAQWEIIRMLCSDKGPEGTDTLQPGKLFVVGDKRQAIYRFRGGDVTVFETVTEEIKASNSSEPAGFFWQIREMDPLLSRISRGYPGIRDGHARSFETLEDEEKKRMLSGDIYLSLNFRTDAGPVDFINRIFREIFGNRGSEGFERYETPHSMIEIPETKRIQGCDRGSAAIYMTPAIEGKRDNSEKEASLIADIIDGILGRKGAESEEYRAYGDIREKMAAGQKAIGILFFRFTHIKTFEEIFRESGLDFMVHRGKGFFRCSEVMEIIQLLNYISDQRQRISLLSALRSPIFGVTDAEVFDLFYGGDVTIETLLASENAYINQAGEQLKAWRFLSCRLTIAELIRTIVRDRGLTAINSLHPDGRRRTANIEKLMDTARNFQAEGSGSLPGFVDYCLRMADEEEEEGEAQVITGGDCPITLMTVHAAKGLEFPMVIIPDLDHKPPDRLRIGAPLRLYPSKSGEQGQWNSSEGSIPVWQLEIPELGFVKRYSPLGYLLNRRNGLEAFAENRRVFYVACTRAMNHLILTGSMKKRRPENGGSELTSGDYRERASVMDILDDIYGFNRNYPPESECVYPGDGESPVILRRDPEMRGYKGIDYRSDMFLPGDFGQYDEDIRRIDLSDPVISPSYYQISFKSLKIYRECPMKFYYGIVLGARDIETGKHGASDQADNSENGWAREDDETDSSENALKLGLLVHAYLERHHFGEDFNRDMFENLWERASALNHGAGESDSGLPVSVREKALAQLERTVKDERLLKIFIDKRDYAEVPFMINISRGIDFRGVIDRVLRNKTDGSWSIIDWKSNDLRGKNPKDVAEQNGYFLQLSCYKNAVERITGEKAGKVYVYFTDTGDMVQGEGLPDAGDFLREVSEKIREYSDKGPPDIDREVPDAEKCRLCRYREMCRSRK